MIKYHELKIKSTYFDSVECGDKKFEIRKDDRGFQKGDIVRLKELKDGSTTEFTGNSLLFTIGYVTAYEQKDGYVVFSLLPYKD